MNSKLSLMKNEIRIISKYQALILSKYYFTATLSFISFYLGVKRMAVSSLYILIMLNALPPIFVFFLKDYSIRYNKFLSNLAKDIPFQLSFLKAKYNFSRIKYLTNAVAYLIMILLICLWQINYYNEEIKGFLSRLPLTILIIGLTLRFSAVIFYRIKLSHDLMYNRI